jgi:hypothetical protein
MNPPASAVSSSAPPERFVPHWILTDWGRVVLKAQKGDTCGGCLERLTEVQPASFHWSHEPKYYAAHFFCVKCRRTLPCCSYENCMSFCGQKEGPHYVCRWCFGEPAFE